MADLLFPSSACERPLTSEIRRSAWIDVDLRLRFTLIRRWREGPLVNFIGHNGASAGADKDDPTSHRWIHFASAWGFGGYIGTNLYPFMTADPEACRQRAADALGGADWGDRDLLMQNVDVVRKEAKAAGLVVACWGNLAQDQVWTEHIIEEITSGDAPWPDLYCLGKTLSGAPVHPMARGKHRIPDDVKPVIWRTS